MTTRREGNKYLLLPFALLLSGCGVYYWTQPDASLPQFQADHRACIEQSALPVVDRPGYVVQSEDNFKMCMAARGWTRELWMSRGVDDRQPPTFFRGIEDFPARPMSVNALSQQGHANGQ
jgi:hypothetical protein